MIIKTGEIKSIKQEGDKMGVAFCKDCKHLFAYYGRNVPAIYRCQHPRTRKDCWYGPKHEVQDPRVINENFDCPWIEYKE